MVKLYPLLFEPNLRSVVWGGEAISRWKQLSESLEPIGESWEVSAVPSAISVISNGELKGRDLVSVINDFPQEILGKEVARQYGNQLPLLVKFIDAHQDLSIQVHPNDEMASRLHGMRGKTEMWYVLDAKPGAYLYSGFGQPLGGSNDLSQPQQREKAVREYMRRIENGTITEVLAKHEVKEGDVFYLPAGRVHAICSGILLAEVQQSSDVTYRIFDYNRLGMDGKLRELHTELAGEALDYHVEDCYRTPYEFKKGVANAIVDSSFFSVWVSEIDKSCHRDMTRYDSFVITMCLKGDCKIRLRESGEEVCLKEGYSTLIPAAVADYDVIPHNASGQTKILDAFINTKNNTEKHP